MKSTSISVFFPAFNEESNISQAINSTYKYLKKNFKDFEIIVVDDGSTDKTLEIAQTLAKKIKQLKIVKHFKNRGYGAALRSGFAACTKDLIFYTDSDNQFDISELSLFLPQISNYDIIIGYRIDRKDPFVRLLVGKAYNLFIYLLFRGKLKVKDVDCAFKLYKRSAVANLKLKSETGFIDAELLLKAIKNGYKIKEVGVRHFPRVRGTTKYGIKFNTINFGLVNPKVITDIFKEIRYLWQELQ